MPVGNDGYNSTMHRRIVVIAITLLLLIGVGAGYLLLRRPPPPMMDEPLWGLLVRKQCVLASGIDGLYRAELTDQKWRRVRMPPGMPGAGQFASESLDATDIYYYSRPCPPRLVRDGGGIPAMPGVRFGLYRSHDEGRSWELATRYNRFGSVYVHPDGALFAMNYGPAPGMPGTGGDEQLCISRDGGVTWRDITNGLSLGSEVFPRFKRFAADPQHPHQACLALGGLSWAFDEGYAADDQNYHWRRVDQIPSDVEGYFARSGLGVLSWDQPRVEATLANYFENEFGAETSICALAAVPERRHYVFSAAEPKAIRITVRYLAAEGSIKFADALDKWDLQTVGPDREANWISFDNSEAAPAGGTGKPGIIRIDRAHPYVRQLTISDPDAFEIPGIYRVQLRHGWPPAPANVSFKDPKHEVFVGQFAGPVFTVEIKGAAQR
jgi:hypothetical protein